MPEYWTDAQTRVRAGNANDIEINAETGRVVVVTEHALQECRIYEIDGSAVPTHPPRVLWETPWRTTEEQRRWPAAGLTPDRVPAAVSQVATPRGWVAEIAAVKDGILGLSELGSVRSDRGVRINSRGAFHLNTGQYSAQGIGTYWSGWIGADRLRELWQSESGFYARDMTDDGAWVIGNDTDPARDRVSLIDAKTRGRFVLFEGLAYEPRVAWDGRRVWAVAGGGGWLRLGSWSRAELEARRWTPGGEPVATAAVEILDYVKRGIGPMRCGMAYRTRGVVEALVRVRPAGADEFGWLSDPIAVADAGGYAEVELRDPGLYEIGLLGRAASGVVVTTGRVRVVTVEAPPVTPPVAVVAQEWDRLQDEVDGLLHAVARSVGVVADPERADAMRAEWRERYVALRQVGGLSDADARADVLSHMTEAVVDRIKGVR